MSRICIVSRRTFRRTSGLPSSPSTISFSSSISSPVKAGPTSAEISASSSSSKSAGRFPSAEEHLVDIVDEALLGLGEPSFSLSKKDPFFSPFPNMIYSLRCITPVPDCRFIE